MINYSNLQTSAVFFFKLPLPNEINDDEYNEYQNKVLELKKILDTTLNKSYINFSNCINNGLVVFTLNGVDNIEKLCLKYGEKGTYNKNCNLYRLHL